MNDVALRISVLITKYLNNELTAEEEQELAVWKGQSDNNLRLFEKLTGEGSLFNTVSESYTAEANIYNKIKQHIPELNEAARGKLAPMRAFNWRKITAAAAIIVALAIGSYMWLNRTSSPHTVTTKTEDEQLKDKPPGKDGAILQIADGKQIILDDAMNGNLSPQGNTEVVKLKGTITYNNKGGSASTILYNTLSTPRGRKFQVTLPDGSHVWLNASSSIKFPNVFTGNNRVVEITGEVYLEVAKDKKKPFIVNLPPRPGGQGGGQVEVLGTHFNINAYSEETTVKTTLLEGAVKVTVNGNTARLTPGKQAQIKDEKIAVITDADTDATVAWKNGIIAFDRSDIKTVLRQVSRWYNVDIEYKGDIKVQELRGKVPRNIPLSDVLKALALSSNLKFSIERNKVLVY
jgi:transmembrane sensor